MFLYSMFLTLFLSFFCLCGCGSKQTNKHEIALDPTWYPLDFQGKNTSVVGFSTELLRLISREEFTTYSLLYTNWDSLLQGLTTNQYAGILSSIYPYNFNQKKYDFSEVYLPTGPVLILPTSSSYRSLHDIRDKQVAALTGSSSILLLEKYPKLLISFCNSVSEIINQLQAGQVVGALLPWPIAQSFTQGSFQSQFIIASAPLNEEGLRLITLKGKHSSLIHHFNRGLEKLKKSNQYEQLLIDWGLVAPTS